MKKYTKDIIKGGLITGVALIAYSITMPILYQLAIPLSTTNPKLYDILIKIFYIIPVALVIPIFLLGHEVKRDLYSGNISWLKKKERNAFIFHGTEGYPQENWFPWLKQELEKLDYKVHVPQFPSPPNIPAKISKWFEVLQDYEKYINEDTILIGHSLGGIFNLRILEKLKNPVKAAVFVGTPIGIRPILNYDRDKEFSGFIFDWENIVTKAKHFMVFQSDNDPFVSLGNGELLAKNLKTKLTFVPNAGHFNKKAGYTKFELLLDKLREI